MFNTSANETAPWAISQPRAQSFIDMEVRYWKDHDALHHVKRVHREFSFAP